MKKKDELTQVTLQAMFADSVFHAGIEALASENKRKIN